MSEHDEDTQPEVVTTTESSEVDNQDVDQGQAEAPKPDLNKIIAEKAFGEREAKREAKEAKEQLAQLQQQMQPQTAPEVPPLPSEYDFDSDAAYHKALQERDEKLMAKAQFDAQQKITEQQNQERLIAEQQQQRQKYVEVVKNYSNKAEKLGIKPEELQVAGGRVSSFGLDDNLTNLILNMDDGPLVTMHLSANPHELDQLVNMNPYQAAIALTTQIAPKAAALKPQLSNAPPPPDQVSGTGYVKDSKYRNIQGATFE